MAPRIRSQRRSQAKSSGVRRGVARRRTRASAVISVRALHTRQGNNDVYAFFMPGNEITQIADIIRVARDERHVLKGFQRKEIRNHVRDIV